MFFLNRCVVWHISTTLEMYCTELLNSAAFVDPSQQSYLSGISTL